MSTAREPLPKIASEVAQEVVLLDQEATATFTIEGFQMPWATEVEFAPESEWEQYLRFEAARRGVTIDVVRDEEQIAQSKLSRIILDRKKLYAAAKACSDDHPYLHDEDSD